MGLAKRVSHDHAFMLADHGEIVADLRRTRPNEPDAEVERRALDEAEERCARWTACAASRLQPLSSAALSAMSHAIITCFEMLRAALQRAVLTRAACHD